MALHDPVLRVILDEGEGTRPLTADERFEAVRALLEKGFPVARPSTAHPTPMPPGAPVLVVGAFTDPSSPPAPGATGSPTTSRMNLNGTPAPALLEAAESVRARAGAPAPGAWLPWFPVIDYDRCTNCMQCLSFCLFGVYGVDPAGRIQAQQQDNCKTNCPACSRVCPEAAIMFPKYKAGPINGDNVSDSDLQREKMKIDISALLGGDVYSLLRDRSERARSRFGKERDADKALAERQKCLVKLGEIVADLPPEVLASLPSPDQIARKAEEARQRAAAATATAANPGT
jgi:Pyruvate/2-oxoacid:ferredoxin oxidoreductase delta subunit